MAVRKRKWVLLSVALVAAAVAAGLLLTRPARLDTRFNGAYRLDDGRLLIVTPREGETLRYRMMSGESRALWPTGEATYEAGPGWSDRDPIEVTIEFDGAPGHGLELDSTVGSQQRGARLELPESIFTFQSGDLELRGKLVLPLGSGPFPAVVLVHGSGKESAVDSYYMPYLFAAHGVATLVYDKRGTGESAGDYTQNFDLLADDAVAAVEWLRDHSDVDPSSIHLAGYSQGGWIAPLAASRIGGVRGLLLCYGPMVPVLQEDRWGYVYALREAGFGDQAIAEADRVNDHLGGIFDRAEDRWAELGAALDEVENEEWFEVVKTSDSMLGFVAGTGLPIPAIRLYHWWMTRGRVPYIDRLYDPVPTLAALDVPSLWIFGGADSSMPTEWSIRELEALQESGLPIEIDVFPNAEHGILLYEESDSGDRKLRGYAPGYFARQVDWLLSNSGS